MTNYTLYTQRLFIQLTTLYMSLYFYHHVIAQGQQVSVSANNTIGKLGTSACTIPYYWKSFKLEEPARSKWNNCGIRAVNIEKSHKDKIRYFIDDKKITAIFGNRSYNCCYQYALRSNYSGKEDTAIEYTPCTKFQNHTTAILMHEVIKVTCRQRYVKKKKNYEDVYIVLKKLKVNESKNHSDSWNVLLLGMDTMSRMRAFHSMPKTIKYFKDNNWLDYRKFLKASGNTFQNVINLLMGKKIPTVNKACGKGMSHCNDLMIWSQFKKRGYMTAYGEDNLKSSDTFSRYYYNGFKVPPTDHYIRPLFLTGEKPTGNIVCTKRKPSALHLLDYAYQFATAYKNEKFFGVFWINSYSHNSNSLPTLLQEHLIDFFEKLNNAGVLHKTIVFFFSDHGIRFGNMKIPVESYYDERLPMLFMRIPHSFQKRFQTKYRNLYLNQYRLTTHYDLHSTMWDILKLSNKSIHIIPPEACPQCNSLFEEKSKNRTCQDMNVNAKWCSCHVLQKVSSSDIAATVVPEIALYFLNNKARKIKTKPCYKCSILKLETILRHHWYKEIYNVTYYVVALQVVPGNAQFEATIEANDDKFQVLPSIEPISTNSNRYMCALNKYDHAYCVCEKIGVCGHNVDLHPLRKNQTVNSVGRQKPRKTGNS